MASRNKTKATEAIDKLREEIGKEALFLELDLSSLASVRRAAEEYLSYVSVHHAGVCVIQLIVVVGRSGSCTSCSTTRKCTAGAMNANAQYGLVA